MQEMWKSLKFALDLRAGDSKPVPKEGSDGDSTSESKSGAASKTGSRSLLNGNNDVESNPYGVINHRNGQESPYAVFTENNDNTYNSQTSKL